MKTAIQDTPHPNPLPQGARGQDPIAIGRFHGVNRLFGLLLYKETRNPSLPRAIIIAIILSCLILFPQLTRAADEIVLGAPTSMALLEGRESVEAALLAVEEINARGGVDVGGKKMPLRLEPIDLLSAGPGADPEAALGRFERFIAEKKPNALVVGPFRSEVLLAGMDAIAENRLPLLGAIAMSAATEAKFLREPRHKYVFRVCLNAKYLVEYLIEHMEFLHRRFGFDRVFIMNQDVAWARATASLTMKLYLNRSEWKVLGQETYPEKTADFSPGLAAARDRGAQVILCLFDAPQSGALAEQWNRMKVPALLTGFISPMVGPQAWDKFGGRIGGALSMVFELGNMPSDRHPPAARFYRAFQERFGREIEAGHGPAPAYESVYILAEAMTRAGTLEPDALVAALEKTDRPGVMGRIRFHQGHQAIFGDDPSEEALACLFQWTADGKRRIVLPESLAEGEIELPAFMQSPK